MSANTYDWTLMDWDGFDLAWFDLLLDRGAGSHFAPIPISKPDQRYAPAETLINWLSGGDPIRVSYKQWDELTEEDLAIVKLHLEAGKEHAEAVVSSLEEELEELESVRSSLS